MRIAGLGIFGFGAVMAAGLAQPSAAWAAAAATLTFVALVVLTVIACGPRTRPGAVFCRGMVLSWSAYLLAGLGTLGHLRQDLPTHHMLAWLHDHVLRNAPPETEQAPAAAPQSAQTTWIDTYVYLQLVGEDLLSLYNPPDGSAEFAAKRACFFRIGHLLFGATIALGGGLALWRLSSEPAGPADSQHPSELEQE